AQHPLLIETGYRRRSERLFDAGQSRKRHRRAVGSHDGKVGKVRQLVSLVLPQLNSDVELVTPFAQASSNRAQDVAFYRARDFGAPNSKLRRSFTIDDDFALELPELSIGACKGHPGNALHALDDLLGQLISDLEIVTADLDRQAVVASAHDAGEDV